MSVGDLWRACYRRRPGEVHLGGVRWVFGVRYVASEHERTLSALVLRTGWQLVADAEPEHVEPMGAPLTVIGVVGDVLSAAPVWPDGSYTCPWCGAAVIPGVTQDFGSGRPCGNPWCAAGGASLEQVERRREQAAANELRRQASERRAAELSRWQEDDRARRVAAEQEVAKAGQCVICFRRSGGRRRVRHRRPDFHTGGR